MTKLDYLKVHLLSKPKDFTFEELSSMLGKLGYEELKLGKTSGSRVAYFNPKSKHVIRLHKPHPSNILKGYVIKNVIQELKKERLI